MALFTDAGIVTLDDLLPFESTLVQIASSHGIDVDTKINLSTSMINDRLMLWLVDAGASDPQWLNRRLLGLSTVVVTTTLHRWLCFDSLSRFFAEAYNVQLNTRFEGKWTEYQQAAKDSSNMVFMSGIGIVYKPLPKPAMPIISSTVTDPLDMGFLSGIGIVHKPLPKPARPIVGSPAGNAPTEALFVQTAWVDATGGESALSPVNGIVLNGALSVTIAMAEGAMSPPAASGWNVYVSSAENDLTRQNTAALTIGETWHLPASGLASGPAPLNGQQPNYYIAVPTLIQRG